MNFGGATVREQVKQIKSTVWDTDSNTTNQIVSREKLVFNPISIGEEGDEDQEEAVASCTRSWASSA